MSRLPGVLGVESFEPEHHDPDSVRAAIAEATGERDPFAILCLPPDGYLSDEDKRWLGRRSRLRW